MEIDSDSQAYLNSSLERAIDCQVCQPNRKGRNEGREGEEDEINTHQNRLISKSGLQKFCFNVTEAVSKLWSRK